MKTIISNVLIFKGDNSINGLKHPTEVTFTNPLPLTFNFNQDQTIGTSNLRTVGNDVYADIEIDKYASLRIFGCTNIWPYIGGENGDVLNIKTVSIGPFPNVDETIPEIKPSQVEMIKGEVYNPRILDEK